MVVLQQQTLTAVNALVDIQQQLLEATKEEIIMKKIKLIGKGWVQDLDGNWVGIGQRGRNNEEFAFEEFALFISSSLFEHVMTFVVVDIFTYFNVTRFFSK